MTEPGAPGSATTLWARNQAFGVLRLIAVLAAVVSIGFLWIRSDGRLPEASVWQATLVLLLLVLSLPWRTVSSRTVAGFFFIGFGPIFLLTVLTQALLVASPLQGFVDGLSRDMAAANVGWLGNVHANVWAPITEEVWKVVPLLLLFAWRGSQLRTQGGPLDFAILAAATGAGLGFAEDLLAVGGVSWSVPSSPLLGLGIGTLYVALVVNPLNASPLEVFPPLDLSYESVVGTLNPSVEQLSSGAIWAGHGVLPLAVGLALGFAVLGARRYRTPLVYLLPVVVLLWVTWEHFVGNWYSAASCTRPGAPTLCGFAHLDLAGGLLPLAVIGGWVLATVASRRIVERHRASDPVVHLPRTDISAAAYRGSGIGWPVRFARDLLRYLRLRARCAFGWLHFALAAEGERRRQVMPLLAARTEAAILARRLRNQPVPELPPATDRALYSTSSPL